MQWKILLEDFSTSMELLKVKEEQILSLSSKVIQLARKTLSQMSLVVKKNEFNSDRQEIDFFKNIKQVPLVPLIYYSEVRSFELQFPLANPDTQKKYIDKKIAKLNRFFSHNIDFIQYISEEHSHFDAYYFTRKFSDNYHIVSSKFYFQDPDFTTARDMLLGKAKAYKRFIKYLQEKLKYEQHGFIEHDNIAKLKWTSTKTALTELIYALHCNGTINHGNTDIKEIATTLQKIFHFELGDFYKIFAEIKSRKNSRTKFLDDLSTGLISAMDKSEN